MHNYFHFISQKDQNYIEKTTEKLLLAHKYLSFTLAHTKMTTKPTLLVHFHKSFGKI